MKKNDSMRCLRWLFVFALAIQMAVAVCDGNVEATSGGISAVSMGTGVSAVLKKDGSLWMWGRNNYGQLGNGTNTGSNVPIKVLDGVKAVSLGGGHSAALKNDGSLWMWGRNNHGQLGNGNTTNSSVPVKVLDGVRAVSLGYYHSAAIKEDGSLWLWGTNSDGELGNGSTADSSTPVRVLNYVKMVSLGGSHSAAIKENGSLWMWGDNTFGRLGDGTSNKSSVPVQIMDDVKAVSLGVSHGAAVREDGSLWTWGYNGYGSLGNGTDTSSKVPVKIMDNVKAVSLGEYHTGALKEDGSLWLWGYNYCGCLGDGSSTERKEPVKALNRVREISIGSYHSAAVTEDGNLWLWGDNDNGELGDGTNERKYVPGKNPYFIFTLSDAVLSLGTTSYVYDGSAKMPAISVVAGAKTLTSGTDYSASYQNNILAGTAGVTVTGAGDYEGTISASFTIEKASVKTAAVSLSRTAYTYDGQAKTPAVTVKLGSRTLTSGTNYTVSYSNHTMAGTASVTVTGKGNYKDTASRTFSIAKASIASAAVSLSPSAYEYDGQEKTPSVTVKLGSRTLASGADYAIVYSNNRNAGTATVTITGTGNYTGTASKTFTIQAPASLQDPTQPADPADGGGTETGKASQPAGGSGNTGKTKPDVSGAVLQLSRTVYTYNMENCTPSVMVTLGGTTLKKDRDYTVAYTNNINAGTASAVISGIGNYTGKKSIPFIIQKADQTFTGVNSAYTLKEGDSMSLAAARVSAVLKNSAGNVTVVSEAAKTYRSSDTSVVYVDGSGLMKAGKAGSASITITDSGTGNLNGVSFTLTVKVEKDSTSGTAENAAGKTHIGSCEVVLKKTSYTYTGKALKPGVSISLDGRTLTADTDYSVTYLNNKNAGQAIVRVTGKGSYTGQKDKTFTIKKKAQKITAKNITLTRSSRKQTKKLGVKVRGGAKITYTPSSKKITVKKGKVVIPAGFTGLCKIRIKAASTQNYKTGSKTIKVTVNPPATTLSGLSVSPSTRTYKVSWKAVSGVTGYEVQMALDGKFRTSVVKKKTSSTSAEFRFTERKTYYFRVRTFQKTGGKVFYSKWSKVQYRKAG